MEDFTMKTKIIGLLAILMSCSLTKNTINDDIYSTSKDKYLLNSETNYYQSGINNIPQNSNTNYSEQITEKGSDGNTYVTNNYYNFDPDDYYDYSYTARIRRFHRPYLGFGYFDGFYTNLYWYTYDPWDWGISIYFGYHWWPYYHYYYYPATVYIGFYYPWYYYWWHPYYYYFYDPFFHPYGWYDYHFGYWHGYWHGYHHGYWNGYWHGYYDALAYNYYYNSYDGTYYGPLSDIPTSGSHRVNSSSGNYHSFVNTFQSEVLNKPVINSNQQTLDKPSKDNIHVINNNPINLNPQTISINSNTSSKDIDPYNQRQPAFETEDNKQPQGKHPIINEKPQSEILQEKPEFNRPAVFQDKPTINQSRPSINQDRPTFNPPTYNQQNIQRPAQHINEQDKPAFINKPSINENYYNRPTRSNENEIEYRRPSHNNYNRTIDQPRPSYDFNNRPSNINFSQPYDNGRSGNNNIERKKR